MATEPQGGDYLAVTAGYLAVTVLTTPGCVTVAAAGEIDLYSHSPWREALTLAAADVCAGACARLVIDLARVTFLDSAGLAAIVTCFKAVSKAGRPRESITCRVLAGTNPARVLHLGLFERIVGVETVDTLSDTEKEN